MEFMELRVAVTKSGTGTWRLGRGRGTPGRGTRGRGTRGRRDTGTRGRGDAETLLNYIVMRESL